MAESRKLGGDWYVFVPKIFDRTRGSKIGDLTQTECSSPRTVGPAPRV